MEIIILFFFVFLGLIAFPWYSKLHGGKLWLQWLKNIPEALILLLYCLTCPGLSTALVNKKRIRKYFK